MRNSLMKYLLYLFQHPNTVNNYFQIRNFLMMLLASTLAELRTPGFLTLGGLRTKERQTVILNRDSTR